MAANPFVSLLKWVAGNKTPGPNDDYIPIRALPQKKNRFGFGRVIANGVDPAFGLVLAPVGAAMTVAQTAGNLVMTTGTTINQDTIVRSAFAVTDPYTLRWSTVISQRIANQQLIVELVDVIGDALPATILSATQIRVTLPTGKVAELGWNAQNIGQTVGLGNYSGTGTFVPINAQAATIAAIAGDQVTFNTSGMAAGSGTISVFGWNYHRFIYDASVSATQIRYQSQRNGWPGPSNTLSIASPLTPGHIGVLNVEDNIAAFLDMLRAPATGVQMTSRGSNVQDMPGNETPLFLQLRMANGSVAPASSTTWTVAFVDVDNYTPQQVSVTSVRPQSIGVTGIPVMVQGGGITASQQATQSTGCLAYFVQSTAQPNGVTGTNNTTGVVIKTTAGQIYELTVSNNQATGFWLKLYNKATAPVVGTDVPIAIIWCPPNAEKIVNFGTWGKRFTLGIGIGITANQAISDTTAPVAGAPVSITYS